MAWTGIDLISPTSCLLYVAVREQRFLFSERAFGHEVGHDIKQVHIEMRLNVLGEGEGGGNDDCFRNFLTRNKRLTLLQQLT